MKNESAAVASRSLAFYVQHTCCPDKKVKSDLNLKLRKEHSDVFMAMVALQNAPSGNDTITNLRRIKLANAFTDAFIAMEARRAAKTETPGVARTATT